MNSPLRRLARAATCLLVLGLATAMPPARATLFVALEEEDLAARSIACVIGEVKRVTSADEDGAIWTYALIAPEQVIFGALLSEPFAVREMGGRVGDRISHVYGVPRFTEGERVLVFLRQSRDGTLQTTELGLGKYTVERGPDGAEWLIRDLGEGVAVVDPGARRLRADPPSERFPLEPFLRRVAAAAKAGGVLQPERPLQAISAAAAQALSSAGGGAYFLFNPPVRWWEPDSGRAIPFLIDADGAGGFTADESRRAALDALGVWNTAEYSSLLLSDGGAAGNPKPCHYECRGEHGFIVFDDPCDVMASGSACGGTIGLGGYCAVGETRTVNGVVFQRITGGRVTLNDGFAGCDIWNLCNLSEFITHEVGHAIGLAHSADPDATMRAFAHMDGRCAVLADDDLEGVIFLYPGSGPTRTPSATPTLSHTPPPSTTSTATPPHTPARSATRTPSRTAPPPCPADCDADRHVSVDELIVCVAMALEASVSLACPACDLDADGTTRVDEVVRGINAARRECR